MLKIRKIQRGILVIEALIGVAILLCIVAIFAGGKADHEKKVAFYEECLKDRKQYECDALWGQAKSSSNNDAALGLATGLAIGTTIGGRR